MKTIKAEELDKKFDDGEEDILQYFDLENPRHPNQEIKRVNIDFPQWIINRLDQESRHLGISRQALVKVVIARHFEDKNSSK